MLELIIYAKMLELISQMKYSKGKYNSILLLLKFKYSFMFRQSKFTVMVLLVIISSAIVMILFK